MESLFLEKKLTRFGQLWVVEVWDLWARDNKWAEKYWILPGFLLV